MSKKVLDVQNQDEFYDLVLSEYRSQLFDDTKHIICLQRSLDKINNKPHNYKSVMHQQYPELVVQMYTMDDREIHQLEATVTDNELLSATIRDYRVNAVGERGGRRLTDAGRTFMLRHFVGYQCSVDRLNNNDRLDLAHSLIAPYFLARHSSKILLFNEIDVSFFKLSEMGTVHNAR